MMNAQDKDRIYDLFVAPGVSSREVYEAGYEVNVATIKSLVEDEGYELPDGMSAEQVAAVIMEVAIENCKQQDEESEWEEYA